MQRKFEFFPPRVNLDTPNLIKREQFAISLRKDKKKKLLADKRKKLIQQSHEPSSQKQFIEYKDNSEDLELTDLSIGEGAVVQVGDCAILLLLIGNADSGDILFETWSEGQPTLIQVVEGYSIPGLYEGLQGMAVGGTRAMSVPAELAFGDEGIPDLGLAGGTPILLVVELVGTY